MSILLLLMLAPVTRAAAASADSEALLSSGPLPYARSLPAISRLDREASQDESPSAREIESYDDSPLDPNLLLLAAWLPIAAAGLALAMDSDAAQRSREARPSLWVE